jgi:hypothetical protein
LASLLLSIRVANEDHGIGRLWGSCEKEQSFPRHGGVQGSRFVLKVSMGSEVELSGELAHPVPLEVTGAFLQASPVAMKVKTGGIDPLHLPTEDSICQAGGQAKVRRGLADNGKGVGRG